MPQENLRSRGRGIILATDHSVFHTGINTLASSLGLNPFSTFSSPSPARVFTSTADFNFGNYTSVNGTGDKLVISRFTSTPYPLLWVPISGRGTIMRINTGTAQVAGEYMSAPSGRNTYVYIWCCLSWLLWWGEVEKGVPGATCGESVVQWLTFDAGVGCGRVCGAVAETRPAQRWMPMVVSGLVIETKAMVAAAQSSTSA